MERYCSLSKVTAEEKNADCCRFSLLDWSAKNGETTKAEPRLKLALTHEEIAQRIRTSRTRLLADLQKQQIVRCKASTLLIRNKAALRAMARLGTDAVGNWLRVLRLLPHNRLLWG